MNFTAKLAQKLTKKNYEEKMLKDDSQKIFARIFQACRRGETSVCVSAVSLHSENFNYQRKLKEHFEKFGYKIILDDTLPRFYISWRKD